MIIDAIGLLITGLVVLVLVMAVMAPFEALGWYAGWFGEHEPPRDVRESSLQQAAAETIPQYDHYIVYLSGIGAITAESVPDEEIVFLNALEPRLTGSLLIRDIYPYSATNVGLTGQRISATIWRWLEQKRLKNPNAALANLVNIRNLLQVAVSADSRYGPIYNLGVANGILRGLVRHGYVIGSGKPVTLIGWSGGGQISIGAAGYLFGMIAAPLRVISVGGVMSSDPGILSVVHLYHFYGEKDPVQNLGKILYPGRWASAVTSPWNRAMAAGRITMTSLGPFGHNGKGNYFDMESQLPDGQIYGEKTIEAIVDVLNKAHLLAPAQPAIGVASS